MRQALAVHVAHKMSAADVLEVLYPLFITHGMPHYIRSDNGPEFTADVFQKWLTKVGIKPIRIYPGSPWENGYNERFNGTLRHLVSGSSSPLAGPVIGLIPTHLCLDFCDERHQLIGLGT